MRHIHALLFGAMGMLVAGPASGAVISSSSFSLAYGVTSDNSGPVWTTDETAAGNTPTVQGDFTFSPAPTGPSWDSVGPTFVGRTLASGGAGGYTGWIGATSTKAFSVPVTASYNGASPVDAAVTPNYRIILEITNISIYGGAYDGSAPSTMSWDEVTPGHAQASPAVNLVVAIDSTNAANYRLVAWDPSDFNETLGSLNASYTRTFDILPGTDSDYRYVDGLVVEGRVHLVYDAVPEPASFALLAAGLPIVLRRRRA